MLRNGLSSLARHSQWQLRLKLALETKPLLSRPMCLSATLSQSIDIKRTQSATSPQDASLRHKPVTIRNVNYATSLAAVTAATTTTAEATSASASATTEALSASPSLATGNIVWETISDPSISVPVINGAILPWAEMNFFQHLVFPFTYPIMYYLDFLQQHLDWTAAIMLTTITMRAICLPLVVKQTQSINKLHNCQPEAQRIQQEINEAMCSGDQYQTALARSRLSALYSANGLNFRERFAPIALQMPIFISVFMLLRKLSVYQAGTLSSGGALWFKDLSVADPYLVLPLIASLSTLMVIELGVETNSTVAMSPMARWGMRAIPVCMFAFIYSFPASILLYWSTSNIITLGYSMLARQSWFMKRFNIAAKRQFTKEELPLSGQSISKQWSKMVQQSKAKQTTYDVRRLDDIAFRKAGIGPLRKTYKEKPF